jgi:hypothetical protein
MLGSVAAGRPWGGCGGETLGGNLCCGTTNGGIVGGRFGEGVEIGRAGKGVLTETGSDVLRAVLLAFTAAFRFAIPIGKLAQTREKLTISETQTDLPRGRENSRVWIFMA